MASTDHGVAPDLLAAVMVCSQGDCARFGPSTLDALRPLLAGTPRAILMSTGCLHPGGQCPGVLEVGGVRLQLCANELRPQAPSMAVVGPMSATYRQVEGWLDSGGASYRGHPSGVVKQ